MANEKNINSRIQLKHDVEANWYSAGTAANPFIPKAGEVIIYDPDDVYENIRTKVGDGTTPVHLLKWASGCNETVGLEFGFDNHGTTAYCRGFFKNFDASNILRVIMPKGFCGKPVTSLGSYTFNPAYDSQGYLTELFLPKNIGIDPDSSWDCLPHDHHITIYYEGSIPIPGIGGGSDLERLTEIFNVTLDMITLNEKIGDISSALDYLIAQTENIVGQKYYVISEEISEINEEEEIISE